MSEHNILKENSEQITKYIMLLKQQREELNLLIQQQEIEREQLKSEIDRIKYKYKLVAKSLNQRIATRDKYDQTIKEAEEIFENLVQSSVELLGAVSKDCGCLEEAINKKVGTEISKPASFKKSCMVRSSISSGSMSQRSSFGTAFKSLSYCGSRIPTKDFPSAIIVPTSDKQTRIRMERGKLIPVQEPPSNTSITRSKSGGSKNIL